MMAGASSEGRVWVKRLLIGITFVHLVLLIVLREVLMLVNFWSVDGRRSCARQERRAKELRLEWQGIRGHALGG